MERRDCGPARHRSRRPQWRRQPGPRAHRRRRAGSTQIFFGNGAGGFTPGPRLADRAVSPCLGDVDNNGTLDLWLGRAGEDILYLNDGKGNLKQARLLRPPERTREEGEQGLGIGD